MAATYGGLAIMGIGGGILGTLLSALLFLFPKQCEPVVMLIGPFLLPRNVRFGAEEAGYYFYAGLTVMFSVIWVVITLIAVLKKPGEDARVRVAVHAGDREKAQGARLDPP